MAGNRSRTSCSASALAAGLTLLACAAAARGQDPGGPTLERPAYKFLRHAEDWSVLRDATEAQLDDPWDSIKYVPLSADGETWASFGGHLRLRLEDWSGFGFGSPATDDDTFLLGRLALHADLHVGRNLRAFVEGKSALASDRDLPGGRRTIDVDSLDLEQAFLDLRLPLAEGPTLTLRPGRQAFSFGKQRLVSPLPWANTLRRWDGVSAILATGPWNVHGFWSQFVPVRKYEFNEADSDIEFFGAYATGKVPGSDIGLDLCYLGLRRASAAFNGTIGAEQRHTLGGRLSGSLCEGGLDYDLEGAYQFGEVGRGDIRAFMIGSQLGYRFSDVWGAPRVFLGFDYASGDRSPGGDVGTFNQLFPLGHAFLGYIDTVGRQNVIALNPGVSFTPTQKLTASASGHFFWRAEDSDAFYDAGGGVVRAGSLGDSRELGAELDLTLAYSLDRHMTALFGYSHFSAGDFIRESGASEDIDFLYVQLEYTF